MLSRLVLRPRVAPSLAGHGPGRPPPPGPRRRIQTAVAEVRGSADDVHRQPWERKATSSAPRASTTTSRPTYGATEPIPTRSVPARDTPSVGASAQSRGSASQSPPRRPRQKMPRGGPRPPPVVPGESSAAAWRRPSVASFPRLVGGGDKIAQPQRHQHRETGEVPEPQPRTPLPPFDGSFRGIRSNLAYRGAAASDADARRQWVLANLDRERRAPERSPPEDESSPTTLLSPDTSISHPIPASHTTRPASSLSSLSSSILSNPIPKHPPLPRLAPPAPPSLSVIHKLLPFASETSPAEALEYLRSNKHLLVPAAIPALENWASHTHNNYALRRIHQLKLIAKKQDVPYFPISRRPGWDNRRWRNEKQRGGAKIKLNKFLWQQLPPLDTEPTQLHPRSLLRHQHALLLAGKGYTLDECLCRLADLGASSARRLDALHLALAYASPKNVGHLLDEFDTHPLAVAPPPCSTAKPVPMKPGVRPQPFSRQTVHLAIMTRLRHQTTLTDLQAILARFDRHGGRRTPGAETWRHVAKYAFERDDVALAHIAWVGAKHEIGVACAAAARAKASAQAAQAEQPQQLEPTGQDAQPKQPEEPEHDEQPERDAEPAKPSATADLPKLPADHDPSIVTKLHEEGIATALDPPAPHFHHLGRDTTRWNFMMHKFGDRGWAVRGPPDQDGVAEAQDQSSVASFVPRLLRRWIWMGEEGANERRTDLVHVIDEEAFKPRLVPTYPPLRDFRRGRRTSRRSPPESEAAPSVQIGPESKPLTMPWSKSHAEPQPKPQTAFKTEAEIEDPQLSEKENDSTDIVPSANSTSGVSEMAGPETAPVTPIAPSASADSTSGAQPMAPREPALALAPAPPVESEAESPARTYVDSTPPGFGRTKGRRVVIDGIVYRRQKYHGRKVKFTSVMRKPIRQRRRQIRDRFRVKPVVKAEKAVRVSWREYQAQFRERGHQNRNERKAKWQLQLARWRASWRRKQERARKWKTRSPEYKEIAIAKRRKRKAKFIWQVLQKKKREKAIRERKRQWAELRREERRKRAELALEKKRLARRIEKRKRWYAWILKSRDEQLDSLRRERAHDSLGGRDESGASDHLDRDRIATFAWKKAEDRKAKAEGRLPSYLVSRSIDTKALSEAIAPASAPASPSAQDPDPASPIPTPPTPAAATEPVSPPEPAKARFELPAYMRMGLTDSMPSGEFDDLIKMPSGGMNKFGRMYAHALRKANEARAKQASLAARRALSADQLQDQKKSAKAKYWEMKNRIDANVPTSMQKSKKKSKKKSKAADDDSGKKGKTDRRGKKKK